MAGIHHVQIIYTAAKGRTVVECYRTQNQETEPSSRPEGGKLGEDVVSIKFQPLSFSFFLKANDGLI